jgi:small conductance mechanosensitive channel
MELSSLLEPLLVKLQEWGSGIVAMLPNLAVAMTVAVVTVFASKWIGRGAQRGLRKILRSQEIADLLAKVIRVGVLVAGLFAALGVLGLDKTVTSLLAGVGIAGLALGFAFQDIAANFVSGVLMAVRRPFEVGDLVKVSDFLGTVEAIDLRATRLRALTGEVVILPNKDVYQDAIQNFTETEFRRVDVEVGVSYDDDLMRAKELAIAAVEDLAERSPDRDVELFYSAFGESSIDCTLRFWINQSAQKPFIAARSAAIIAIKRAFDTGGISIPFPIRTLDFPASSLPAAAAAVGGGGGEDDPA